jgi:hypothetical protein
MSCAEPGAKVGAPAAFVFAAVAFVAAAFVGPFVFSAGRQAAVAASAHAIASPASRYIVTLASSSARAARPDH